ncbi:hypothetical protein DPMN_165192 [Dreissena polymorpha]|uniref:Uncharacterized protein n=1 Tax=Dreissena polymorpha TaxID=45954 RepID=A0A9D4EWF3_DREPO|nr:hypothetical protein DPMN_165192 [Dreissena polymorpha]
MMIEEAICFLGMEKRSQLGECREFQYKGPQHSNPKRQDCEKHSEALGPTLQRDVCHGRQDCATLEIENKV